MEMKTLYFEDVFPSLVEGDTFRRVRAILKSRSPKVTPPREAASPHLLSGLLRCGGCGAKMFAHKSRSHGKSYIYYVCATAYRQGRMSCSLRSLPAKELEGAVLRNITALILNNRNIKKLAELVNEEIEDSTKELRKRVTLLSQERRKLDVRLERLYDALETGKIDLDDLAPRIRELRVERDGLLKAEAKTRNALDKDLVQQVDSEQVMAYVKDLGRILEVGAPEERREFLKSFVKRIFWADPEITVEYTLPMPTARLKPWPEDVVHIETVGGTAWIRTRDQSVMSRPLCR